MCLSVAKYVSLARQCLLAAVALAAIAGSAPKTARAQIIINGSFEAPVAPAGNFTNLTAGSSLMTGWTIVSGSIDVINNGYWPAYAGVQSIDLDGSAAGAISQTFSTLVGHSYTLSFAYANNSDTGSLVTAAANVVDSASKNLLSTTISHMSSTIANMNYNVFTGSFTADTTSTTVSFTSTDPPASNQGIALDAVSVTANAGAPEPGSLWLSVMGALPIGMLVKKSRSGTDTLD